MNQAKDTQAQEEEKESSNAVFNALLDDNPYWGGQSSNSLLDLLHQIESGFFSRPFTSKNRMETTIPDSTHSFQDIILFHDEYYLAINKPPDVRMDGPYSASILKLLLYQFPPPSLSTLKEGNPTLFMEKISLAHKHCDIPDFCFRSPHQLDYATSGVLLFAKTRHTAAIACKAFQNRTTIKEYVALVHGHISFHTCHIPCLPIQSLEGWQQGTIESKFRNSRKNKKTDDITYRHLPTSIIFDQWKSQYRSQTNHHNKRKKIPHESLSLIELSQTIQLPQIPIPFDQLMNLVWKQVKDHHPTVFYYFDLLACEYNKVLQGQHEKKEKEQLLLHDPNRSNLLPPFFRIQGEEENSFYIHVSLAEIHNQFKVKADFRCIEKWNQTCDPSYIIHNGVPNENNQKDTGYMDDTLYRPALTRCTILQTSEYNGLPISKVVLQPRTGRRHQLRVHMATCGHPIFGDATYEKNILVQDPNDKTHGRITSSRMCLHAHKLSIPLTDGKRFEFVAPDPF